MFFVQLKLQFERYIYYKIIKNIKLKVLGLRKIYILYLIIFNDKYYFKVRKNDLVQILLEKQKKKKGSWLFIQMEIEIN